MPRYRTPLRYPGGKQRLTPFVAEILRENETLRGNYVEPYAGGAGVAMELLLDKQVDHVYLNDSSLHIYAFWNAVLTNPDGFCRRIARATLSIESWKRHRDVVRAPDQHDLEAVGFSTFYLNRCNRSGVLTAGVIGGQAQTGKWRIDARFPRNELIKRIEVIAAKRSRITLSNLDAEAFMRERVNTLPPATLVYCDPPYYERASRLYLNTYQPADHQRLARTIQTELKRPWIASYDGHPWVEKLYRSRRRFRYSLQYSAIRAYEGTEVFIFADQVAIPRTSQLPYVAAALSRMGPSAMKGHRTAVA
jgi:DNA adenine methylase